MVSYAIIVITIIFSITFLNVYIIYFQYDNLTLNIQTINGNKNVYCLLNNMLTNHDYTLSYNTKYDYTLYLPINTTFQNTAILYIPGTGRSFNLMNLGNEFSKINVDFYGIDLPHYGYSYRMKNTNKNYNNILDFNEYFIAISDAITNLKQNHKDVILMGNSVAGLTVLSYTNFNINKNLKQNNIPDKIILDSPLLAFGSEQNLPFQLFPYIYYIVTPIVSNIIVSRAGEDSSWLRNYPFYNDDSINVLPDGKFDIFYNPLANQPIYLNYVTNSLKQMSKINNSIKYFTKIPILLFSNDIQDPHIDIEKVSQIVKSIDTKTFIFQNSSFVHEILLSKKTVVYDVIHKYIFGFIN